MEGKPITMHATPIGKLVTAVCDRLVNVITCVLHLEPRDTGVVAENLYAVRTGPVNFFIYRQAGAVICFDTGFCRQLVLRELDKLGIPPESITHVFLTHSDIDHVDGLSLFKQAQVYLSADEEVMITRKKARLWGWVYNAPIKQQYHLLRDNEVVCIGSTRIRAIATPGHTPGSMSYLLNDAVLISGDAFRVINNKILHRRAYLTMNNEQQTASVRKLASLPAVQRVCTGHSGTPQNFAELMAGWKQ